MNLPNNYGYRKNTGMTKDGPLDEAILKFGTSALAREMGLPVSTVHGWKTANRIPGQGKAHEWRVAQFVAAIERLGRRQSAEQAGEARSG